MTTNKTLNSVQRRVRRVRADLFGTNQRPRLSVERTNMHLHVQLIDDAKRVTLVGMSTKGMKATGNKTAKAIELGKAFGEAAKKAGVKEAIFDRGRFRFHGRVKAFADAARAAGLKM